MGFLAGLGAVAKAAASALGLLEKRQEQLDRQEFKQDGARQQQNEDLTAENEELRKDAEIAMEPSTADDAVVDMLARARRGDELRRARRHQQNED